MQKNGLKIERKVNHMPTTNIKKPNPNASPLALLLEEINKRHNATSNKKEKKELLGLKGKITALPKTDLKGKDALNYYGTVDPKVKDIIDQGIRSNVFSGIGITPESHEPMAITYPNQPSTNVPQMLYGGVMRYPTNDVDDMGFSQYYDIMAQGGVTSQPNAELENGEVFRTPDGNMQQVNGNTHAQGGEAYSLPQGTEILGKLKDPKFNAQYKELGQKLKKAQDKYDTILKSRPTTIARQTALMNLNKAHRAFDELIQRQESQKSNKGNNLGDTGLPRKDLGDIVGGGLSGAGAGAALGPWGMAGGAAVGILSGIFGGKKNVSLEQYTPPSLDKLSTVNTNYYNYQNLNAQDYQNQNANAALSNMSNLKYNANPELQANQEATSQFYGNLRNQSQSQGSYLANLQAGQNNLMRANSSTYANASNMNNQYQQQLASMQANLGEAQAGRSLNVGLTNAANNMQSFNMNNQNYLNTQNINNANQFQVEQQNIQNRFTAQQANNAARLGEANVNEANQAAGWNAAQQGLATLGSYQQNQQLMQNQQKMQQQYLGMLGNYYGGFAEGGVIGQIKGKVIKKPSRRIKDNSKNTIRRTA